MTKTKAAISIAAIGLVLAAWPVTVQAQAGLPADAGPLMFSAQAKIEAPTGPVSDALVCELARSKDLDCIETFYLRRGDLRGELRLFMRRWPHAVKYDVGLQLHDTPSRRPGEATWHSVLGGSEELRLAGRDIEGIAWFTGLEAEQMVSGVTWKLKGKTSAGSVSVRFLPVGKWAYDPAWMTPEQRAARAAKTAPKTASTDSAAAASPQQEDKPWWKRLLGQ